MHFERYTDKYTKEKDNTKLASFYSYDVLSRYIPTGNNYLCVTRVELLGEKALKSSHAMRLNISRVSRLTASDEKKEEKEEEDQQGQGIYVLLKSRNKENDDLTDDIAYEDEENEYEMNYNNSEDSFGMDNGDDDEGPTYQFCSFVYQSLVSSQYLSFCGSFGKRKGTVE